MHKRDEAGHPGLPGIVLSSAGLGVFGKGKEIPDSTYGLKSCGGRACEIELAAVVLEQQAVMIKPRPIWFFCVVWVFAVVAMLQPCGAKAFSSVVREVLSEEGYCCRLSDICALQEVHDIAYGFGVCFKSRKFTRKAVSEIMDRSIPCIQFRNGPQVLKLPVSRLDRQAIGEDDTKERSSNCDSAGDQRYFVISHAGARRLLFAVVGGIAGIGIGLLLGWGWIRMVMKTPNLM